MASQPQGFNGVVRLTDWDWYSFLRERNDLDEVNFWRPSAMGFKALKPTEPFFFKLKAPRQEIAGFGVFSRVVRLPVWQAWEVFEGRNLLGRLLMKLRDSLGAGSEPARGTVMPLQIERFELLGEPIAPVGTASPALPDDPQARLFQPE